MAPEQAQGLVSLVDERTDIMPSAPSLRAPSGKAPSRVVPAVILAKVISEKPLRPSRRVPEARVPPALDELCMRTLEKDRDQRSITIVQMRSQIQDFIEGIATSHKPETLARKVVWAGGSALVFVFLFWYLTGQSLAGLLYPAALFNALGWLFLIVCVGYPLWGFGKALKVFRGVRSRYREPNADEIFTAGFFSHLRWSSSVAPLFQLGLWGKMLLWIIPILMSPAIRGIRT
jgi:hypothetical protein